jgi:hypothetical protein
VSDQVQVRICVLGYIENTQNQHNTIL